MQENVRIGLQYKFLSNILFHRSRQTTYIQEQKRKTDKNVQPKTQRTAFLWHPSEFKNFKKYYVTQGWEKI